nr:hypothetical protein [Tanacetum cinerariifolium]
GEEKKDAEDPGNEDNEVLSTEEPRVNQEKDVNVNSTNNINTVSPSANAASIKDNIYKIKKDERGIVVRNKARLVAHGYTQEEGIDYDEVFALVARIEAIRLFLAYASFKDFVVYQMDMKSAFMYGKIEEEVYVYQPLGFENPEFPDRVYKVEKALYGLHQAPRAWVKGDILLVQVYVDDIIFGSTMKEMCIEFEKMMHKKFQMSSIGELTFFLGLQVTPKDDRIFISQDKLDIMFVVCACARFQVTPKVSYLHVVKRNFRYLKGQPKLGLWHPKDSPFDLEAYTDSDYAGANLDRKSTTRGCQFLMSRLISWQCKKQTVVANSTTKAEYVAASNCCRQVLWIQNQMLYYGYNFMNTKIFIDNESTICIVKNPVFHSKTKHIQIRHHFIRDSYEKRLIQVIKIHIDHNVTYLLTKAFDVSRFHYLIANAKARIEVNTGNSSVNAVGHYLVLPDGMSKHNAVYVIPSHTKKVFSNMRRVGNDFSGRDTPLFPTMLMPSEEEELGEGLTMSSAPQHTQTIIQPSTSKPRKKEKPMKSKNKDTQKTQPSDPTDEALNEKNVPGQSNDPPLSRRVKRLEKKRRSRTYGLKRLYEIGLSARVESSAKEQSFDEEDASKQGRNIADIDVDAEITLVDETREDHERYKNEEMFNIDVLNNEEVFVEDINAATTIVVSIDDITLAQALVEIKTSKPKARDENLAWDNVQAMMDANYELAARLQKEEQEGLNIEEKSRLFVELMDKRKKHFTKLREGEQRRKLATKEFDKTMSWINSFVPMDSEVVKDKAVLIQESSSKRVGDKLDQGRSKKQKVEDDKEQEELKRCLELIPNDGYDVTIDATPLSIKTPSIDYKIYKKGKKSYF